MEEAASPRIVLLATDQAAIKITDRESIPEIYLGVTATRYGCELI